MYKDLVVEAGLVSTANLAAQNCALAGGWGNIDGPAQFVSTAGSPLVSATLGQYLTKIYNLREETSNRPTALPATSTAPTTATTATSGRASKVSTMTPSTPLATNGFKFRFELGLGF